MVMFLLTNLLRYSFNTESEHYIIAGSLHSNWLVKDPGQYLANSFCSNVDAYVWS